MKTKLWIKELERRDRIGVDFKRIRCNCGRWIYSKELRQAYVIDLNIFDWWTYEYVSSTGKYKVKPSKWYGYIGFVPVMSEIPFYFHKWFHKKNLYLHIECMYCNKDDRSKINI